MRSRLLIVFLAMPVVVPTPAIACPDCAAGIQAQVRRGIYDAGFGANLLATALPFGIFLGITAVLHHGLPIARRS